jgi:DNA-directed RNA polymerase subunit RPC12/RpoP
MPTLFLKCRHCGEEFPSPIAVTEAGLHDVMITGMTQACPHCGQADQYNTQDFHVPSELVDQVSPPTSPLKTDPAGVASAQTSAVAGKLAGYSVVTTPEGRKPEG